MPSPTGAIRALIVDDEPPARRRIRTLLQAESDIAAVEECRDGREAIRAIEETAPDLVFLDVQMPEANGFDVVAAVGPDRMPPVIFVTAYDEFALRAFEVHALDYLLKPFDRERFRAALDRARRRIHQPAGAAADPRVLALLTDLAAPGSRFLQRLPVKTANRIRFVSAAEMDYLVAEGNYVRIFAGGRSHLVREPLGNLEARLDPAHFARIHRSTIVRLDRVEELEPLFQGEYVLTLRGGAKVRSSRRYRAKLDGILGLAG
jgi:two-component system, LytTR family, response regulator